MTNLVCGGAMYGLTRSRCSQKLLYITVWTAFSHARFMYSSAAGQRLSLDCHKTYMRLVAYLYIVSFTVSLGQSQKQM